MHCIASSELVGPLPLPLPLFKLQVLCKVVFEYLQPVGVACSVIAWRGVCVEGGAHYGALKLLLFFGEERGFDCNSEMVSNCS